MPKPLEILGSEPVTVAEAKRQCYIPPDDTDADVSALLNAYIPAARKFAEARTWLGLIHGRYEYRLDEFPRGIIEIPHAPLHAVESILYGGTTLSADEYRVDTNSMPGRIEPVNQWPHSDGIGSVVITFEGGYKSDADIGDLKIGMLMLIKSWYDHRDAFVVPDRNAEAVEMPFGVREIFDANSLRRFV